jgi:hypothetical protein
MATAKTTRRRAPSPAELANPMLAWSEARWQQEIDGALRQFGWRAYHTWRSVHSAAGFPDVCAIKVRGRHMRLLFAELKSERGKVSEAQAEWLCSLKEMADAHAALLAFAFPPDAPIPQQLARVSVEVYVWRPSQWDRVLEVLR